jgi:hypothetical protein
MKGQTMKTAILTILALAASAIVLYKAELSPGPRQVEAAPTKAAPATAAPTAVATAAAAPAVPTAGEVYLSPRTDGKDGTGTACDPLNASTQQRFDALFASFGPHMAIHLGPGAYHTMGQAKFHVKPYWKIHGAGCEVTRIIEDKTGEIYCTVFRGLADGVEIEDLSVDCGFQNQQVVEGTIRANAAAIGIGGSHLAVRRCWFKNYGSPQDKYTGENFAVFLGSADPANGEDMVVEDCIFAGITPLLCNGQSVLTLAGGPPRNDLKAGNWARGLIARRNHFTGYHPGCHGITVDGAQGALIINYVFEHFMGACVYQDSWPTRDIVIAQNIMSDVDEGIILGCDDMNNYQIRDNVILVHDGYDLKDVTAGAAHTCIEHTLAVGNQVRIHGAKFANGTVMPDKDVYVASTPTRSSFTYSLTPGGKSETGDNAAGGFLMPIHYAEKATLPDAIYVCDNTGPTRHPPTNVVIDRNVIKPYSSDDSSRIFSSGIGLYGVKNCWVTNNVVFDSGNHADLIVGAVKGFASSVICRDNYHPDGTRLFPRDEQHNLIPGGLAAH